MTVRVQAEFATTQMLDFVGTYFCYLLRELQRPDWLNFSLPLSRALFIAIQLSTSSPSSS